MNNTLIVLFAYPSYLSNGQDRFSDKKIIKTAQMLGKKGDIEGAISLYNDILSKEPNNRQSVQNLKDIYFKYLMYDQGIQFMRLRMGKEPNDIRTHCELGELYFLNNQKKMLKLSGMQD